MKKRMNLKGKSKTKVSYEDGGAGFGECKP
jgi:hypothetical protein